MRSAPGWCIYKLHYFTAVCIYTTKWSMPATSLFFLGPNPVVVYIFGVPTLGYLWALGPCGPRGPCAKFGILGCRDAAGELKHWGRLRLLGSLASMVRKLASRLPKGRMGETHIYILHIIYIYIYIYMEYSWKI